MKYVALLRGINVGGNNKVEMSRLKKVFETLGCKDVTTFINSGNVLFRDTRTSSNLQLLVESAILKEFSLQIPTLIISNKMIDDICGKTPNEWTNDAEQRTDVMFLWEEINNKNIMNKIVIDPKLENVYYVYGALVWNTLRKNVTKGNGIKLIKSDVYKKMTIRNINTVRKIQTLLTSMTD